MANQTASTNLNFDSPSLLGLLNAEIMTVDSGATVTINSDVRFGQNACVPQQLVVSPTTGGEFLLDGRDVWEISYTGGTGNVPALGNLGTNTCTGGSSGATGEFLAIYTALGVNASTAATAMPASGILKLRTKTGNFNDGETITLPGGATVVVNSSTGGKRSWISVVLQENASAQVSVPRLGAIRSRGDWYELGVTNGADGQTFQYPTADLCPAIWVETANGSGVFERWNCASPDVWGSATVRISQDVRGKFFGCTTGGVITIARRATNACGFKPPSGCRVRIPNVLLGAMVSPYTTFSVTATATNRPEFVTTSAGVVDLEYISCSWYCNFVNSYSVSIKNSAICEQLIVQECVTAPSLENVCIGNVLAASVQPLTLATCYSGGNITDVRVVRRDSTVVTSQAAGLSDCTDFTITRLWIDVFSNTTAVTRGNSAARCIDLSRCQNITVNDSTIVGSNFNIQNSSDITINNLTYCDLHNSATSATNPVAAINSANGTRIRVTGFNLLTVSGVETQPHTSVVTFSNSQYGWVRNIGTFAAPYDGASQSSANGTGFFVQGGNSRNIKVQRCYAVRMRTCMIADNNEDQDWWISNVHGDDADTRTVQGTNRQTYSLREGVSTAVGISSYGTHWITQPTSATAGTLTIRGNEPTGTTTGQCSFTGTVRFDGAGGAVMAALNDSITWTTPIRILGFASFNNSAPNITGTNTGNITFEYRIDTGSGYSAWKALNATNLTGETISATIGFLLQVRATTSISAATNLIQFVRIAMNTDATAQQTLYPFNTPNVGYTGTVAGSSISVWNDSTSVFLASGTHSGSSTLAQPDWNANFTGLIRLRRAGYDPVEYTSTIVEDGFTLPVNQTDNALPNIDPGALGITVTDHGASPVTWQSKQWSITITTTNDSLTAAQISNFINWNISQLATFSGYIGHAWPVMIEPDGSEFKTVRGRLIGSAGATLKGIRVVRSDGVTSVPGFSTMMADDGTTYSLPVTNDLTVTSNQSGTLLQIFTSGTQTLLASTTGTNLVYTHNGETVDIVAQKAGFLPQRITGLVLSGDTTQPFTMIVDFNYNPSHGLVYTTDASWNRTTNRLSVPNWGPSIRDVYSLMIDSFISQSSLRNTEFNLSMNGINSLFFTNGAEGTSDSDILNMTGGGVKYLNSSGNVTAEYVGVLSQGVVAGTQVEYELGVTGTVVDTRTTGNVNQIIKVYGDGTHGNFDKRDHLQFKAQRNGYRQAESDILESYGITSLSPSLYVISLNMTAIDGLTLGDPSITGVTITHHLTPVSWDAGDGAKNYTITIEDSGANSGESILRWLNYNLSLDAVFQGKEPFYWPEMVIDNGAKYETIRGVLRDNPDVLAGVRVIRTGGTPHPDFTRFQSDDGTYGIPPTVSTVNISNIVTGSKVRIFNVTTNAETYIGTPGTSYSTTYTEGVGYNDGDTVRVTIHKRGYLTYQTTVVVSSVGWSATADQIVDDVYVLLGIDGSAVTGFSADYINDEVNVTLGANFNIGDWYAWWSYNLESDLGIQNFVGGVTALDVGNFRINDSVVSIYLDNTTATNIRQLDNRRIFRVDGDYPVKSSGGGGIDVVWRNQILIAETGVSGLTASEAATLEKINTLTENIGGLRFTTKALEQAPSGGGGTSDWTSDERNQIRNRLGIDGTKATPSSTPTLATPTSVRVEIDTNSQILKDIDATTKNTFAVSA